MREQIIFINERFSFIMDHIELFLKDYNRLTNLYPYSTDEVENHFGFYFISNANRFVWEHFHIDINDFQVTSNSSSLLTGLVMKKTYIIPPIFSKKKIETFMFKLEQYRSAVEKELKNNYSPSIKGINDELNKQLIYLQIMVDGEMKLLLLEEVCQMIMKYRNIKRLNNHMKEQLFASKVAMELGYLEQIINEQIKLSV